ncbi:MAG: Trm112 family protein [Thaumarchaeota archaeon]|nr:Trm112 family protein [Nitrososphaerota archaeon]
MSASVQRKLLDILACPIDKYYPLKLLEFNVKDQLIVDGVLLCEKCGRFYPIMDEIPVMLPDDLRSKKEDLDFLAKWKSKLPNSVLDSGKPWNLKST